MKPYRNYHDDLIRDLKNPREAVAYLNAAIEDGDKAAFLLAIRNVVEARGGMSKISRSARLHRVSLYKMLSKRGNPGLDTLIVLLNALGARLIVAEKPRHHRAA